MKKWKSTSEVMLAIQSTHERLVSGKIDTAQARAEAGALKAACKLIGLQVEVARARGTLNEAGALPAFDLE